MSWLLLAASCIVLSQAGPSPLSHSPALTHAALILPDSIVSEEKRHAERLTAGWLLMVAHACNSDESRPVGLLKLACLHISFPPRLRIKAPYTVSQWE